MSFHNSEINKLYIVLHPFNLEFEGCRSFQNADITYQITRCHNQDDHNSKLNHKVRLKANAPGFCWTTRYILCSSKKNYK